MYCFNMFMICAFLQHVCFRVITFIEKMVCLFCINYNTVRRMYIYMGSASVSLSLASHIYLFLNCAHVHVYVYEISVQNITFIISFFDSIVYRSVIIWQYTINAYEWLIERKLNFRPMKLLHFLHVWVQ